MIGIRLKIQSIRTKAFKTQNLKAIMLVIGSLIHAFKC
jgi:hypothetical protein